MAPERKDRQTPDAGRIFHGGVACFIRTGLDLEHPTLEVWIEIATRSGKFLLSIVYRPPSVHVEYWTLLGENIQHARDSSTNPIYMCGDFNNDTLNPRNTISRLLNRQDLTIVNCQPTHFSTKPTCLDLFATTTPQKVNLVMTTGPTLSNHSAVILFKDGTENVCGSYTRLVTDYSRANWDRINEQLLVHPWPDLGTDCNLDDAAMKWTEDFNTIVNTFTPTKKITIKDGDKKWINYKIRRLMQLRDRIFRKAKSKPKSHPLWDKH